MAQGSEPGAVTIARGTRRWLRLDNDGLTVRNYFRTYRIGWNEVHWFRDGLGIGNLALCGPDWVLEIVLHDGRRIEALGTSNRKTARPETLAAIRQAAERHAVPALLTGTTDAVHRGEPDAAGLYPDPGGKPGLRQWTGTEWSPFLQMDPASSGPEGVPGSARVWLPLPEPEQRRQWDAAVSRAKDDRKSFGLSMVVMWGAVAFILAVAVHDAGQPKPDLGGVWVTLFFLLFGVTVTWAGWRALKTREKIAQAAKVAAELAGAVDSTASHLDDRNEDPMVD